MIEEQEQARHETINRVDVDGAAANAYGRLAHVASIIDTRLEALWRAVPAFEMHIWSGLAALMSDQECRCLLRRIVAFGESARVVTWVHEPLDDATEALSRSGFLTAELMSGRALRHISQGAGR